MRNIYKFTIPTPFKVGPVNLYLLTGTPLTLVDTGPKTDEALAILEAELKQRGYCLADIEQIIITHAHHDHFGLTKKLVEVSGAKTVVHEKTVPWLENHDEAWAKTVEYFKALYIQAGVPEKVISSFKKDEYNIAMFGQSAPVNVSVSEGDIVMAGGSEWRVIYTPGHSKTCMCLLNQKEGLLISGDHLLPEISSNPLLEPPEYEWVKREPSLDRYMDSLKKTAELHLKEVLPGHGENIINYQALIEERIEQFEQRQDEVLNMVTRDPVSAIAICNNLFPQLPKRELFLGLSEAFGHLDILASLGEIDIDKSGKVDLFYKNK